MRYIKVRIYGSDNNETWLRDWPNSFWTKWSYDSVVFTNLTPEEIDIWLKNFKIFENKRGDRQEFVFHGSSMSGQVGIIKRIDLIQSVNKLKRNK